MSTNIDFDEKQDVSAMKDVFRPYPLVYIYPYKRVAYRYFKSYLLKIEVTDSTLVISRKLQDAHTSLKFSFGLVYYNAFDQKDEASSIYSNSILPKLSCFDRSIATDEHQKVTINIQQTSYFYAVVGVNPINISKWWKCTTLRILPKNNGDTFLRCIGGIVRVSKELLSSHCNYFMDLFEKDKKEYEVDIDFYDMMEVLFTISPINRPISNGITYGACYRVSQQLKWVELADRCADYIENIRRVNPLEASFIAYEGGVEEEAKLYLELKNRKDVNLQEEFEKQRTIRVPFDDQLMIERKYLERVL